jgi:hypothetical protein
MARVWIEGFEGGALDGWSSTSMAFIDTVAMKTGNYCMRLQVVGSGSATKILPEAAEYYASFRYQNNDFSASTNICTFYTSGSVLMGALRFNTTSRKLEACKGSTLIGTGNIQMVSGRVYHIQVRYKPGEPPEGIFQVKLDGVLEIDLSGVDTTDAAGNIGIFQVNSGWNTPTYFDDFVIDNANWPGNSKILGMLISGAGNSTQWDPSTGSNYQCVDEVPAVETDFVSTNVTDEVDTYATTDWATAINSIKSVQLTVRTAFDGAPTPKKLRTVLRCSGADYPHANSITVPGAFVRFDQLWELNPADSAAFEDADLDVLEIGVKAVA